MEPKVSVMAHVERKPTFNVSRVIRESALIITLCFGLVLAVNAFFFPNVWTRFRLDSWVRNSLEVSLPPTEVRRLEVPRT